MRLRSLALLPITFAFALILSLAAVPPDIATQLKDMGRVVNPAGTAKLYRPLQPKAPYPGVKIEREIKYGIDPRMVLDVFAPEKGGGSRPVLIYVAGGAGNKIEPVPNGDAFYDNIMLWAVKNGMTGVNMQRHPGEAWDDPAKAVAMVVRWVGQNISRYKGNPDRVFMWSQSAGNGPASTYVGHPELYGPKGVGIKGAVYMSSPGFNILPATPPAGAGGFGACNDPSAAPGTVAAAPPAGRGPGAPKGDGKAPDGKGGGRGKGVPAQPDAATQLARSNLPGLLNSKVSFFVSAAELDPPGVIAFAETLRDQLCKGGHCPTYVLFKDHSHISEVMSPDTKDNSVTGPILKWMKSVK